MNEERHEPTEELLNKPVLDSVGEKIGKVGDVYIDHKSNEAEWITVRSGLLGRTESLAPLHSAHVEESGVVLPYSADQIRSAPFDDAESDLIDHEDEVQGYFEVAETHDDVISGARREDSSGTENVG